MNTDLSFLYKKFKELSPLERKYAKVVVPLWLSWSIYVLTGVPIL